jgi:hypothetical protein
MRFSDLYCAKVRSEDGLVLGRVRAIHCREGRITRIGVGSGALLHRLTRRARERHIAWDKVIGLRNGEVIVARTGRK